MRERHILIAAQAMLALVLCVPFAGCEEDVFPYRTEKLYAVDPALISHRETASWQVGVPAPAFLALAPDGRLVVAGGRQGVVCATNGAVCARFSWQAPEATAVAVAPDGRWFVGAGDRVVSGGGASAAPMTVWDSLGEHARITGLAADSNQVWVCDAAQRVVWRFDREGRLLGQLPPPGAPHAQAFVVPSPTFPVATLGDGIFWVANPGRHEMRRYAADGQLLTTWSQPGMLTPGFSGCCNPAYVALLPGGELVTSEKKIARVKIYGPDGTFRSVIVPPSVLPGEDGRPVAADRAGRVYVLDGARVRVFERKTP